MNTFIMRSHVDREELEIRFLKERSWIEERMHNLQKEMRRELDRRVCVLEKEWLKDRTRIPVSEERIFKRKSDFPLIKMNVETNSKNMNTGPKSTKQELFECEKEMEEYITMIQMKRNLGIDPTGVMEMDKVELKEKSETNKMEMPTNVIGDIEDRKGETNVVDEGIGWRNIEKEEERFLRKQKVQNEAEGERMKNEQKMREEMLEERQREMEAERWKRESEQRKREEMLEERQTEMEAERRIIENELRKREESLKERQSEMEAERMQMESEQRKREESLKERQSEMESERMQMESEQRKREEMLEERQTEIEAERRKMESDKQSEEMKGCPNEQNSNKHVKKSCKKVPKTDIVSVLEELEQLQNGLHLGVTPRTINPQNEEQQKKFSKSRMKQHAIDDGKQSKIRTESPKQQRDTKFEKQAKDETKVNLSSDWGMTHWRSNSKMEDQQRKTLNKREKEQNAEGSKKVKTKDTHFKEMDATGKEESQAERPKTMLDKIHNKIKQHKIHQKEKQKQKNRKFLQETLTTQEELDVALNEHAKDEPKNWAGCKDLSVFQLDRRFPGH